MLNRSGEFASFHASKDSTGNHKDGENEVDGSQTQSSSQARSSSSVVVPSDFAWSAKIIVIFAAGASSHAFFTCIVSRVVVVGTSDTGKFRSTRRIKGSTIDIVIQIVAGVVVFTALAAEEALDTIDFIGDAVCVSGGRIEFSVSFIACRVSSAGEAECNKHWEESLVH